MSNNFEAFLAKHCAPVLFGKKPAALFAEKHLPPYCAWPELYQRGFRIRRMRWQYQHTLILFYHPALLDAALRHHITQQRLGEIGYPNHGGYQANLYHLQQRFKQATAFPHEVGFFLGYPPHDVIGFMDCATNYTLCGPWKVYSNETEAAAIFAEYEHCRMVLLAHIADGGSLLSAKLPALAG